MCSGFVLTTCATVRCECDVFERALVVYMCHVLVRLCVCEVSANMCEIT